MVDEKNIIRYVDFVLGGGLPDIKGALNAAKLVLLENSWNVVYCNLETYSKSMKAEARPNFSALS